MLPRHEPGSPLLPVNVVMAVNLGDRTTLRKQGDILL
jgi:hypothetical protein